MLAAQLKASGCDVPLVVLPGGAPKIGPETCPKAGADAGGALIAARLGWGAAGPLEAGKKGLAPKLKGAADDAADVEAAALAGILNRPPADGGARLACKMQPTLGFVHLTLFSGSHD